MACAGALTSIIMTAVGAFIANGGLAEVFGGAPVAGAAGSAAEGLVTVYTPSGEIFSMSTAEAVASGIIENTASQSWFSGLGGLGDTLNSMTNSFLEFTAPMREAWSNLATAPAAAGKEVFNSVSGVWGPKTAQFASSVTEGVFKTAITQSITWASETLGGTGTLIAGALVGDPKILGQAFNAANSFAQTANGFINAAEAAGTYLNKTFTNMENTITAGVDGVSKWFEGLGDDISKLGNTVDWANLDFLGYPGQLIANLENSGTLGPFYDKLGNIQVDPRTAQQLGVNITNALLGRGELRLKDLGIDLNQIARQGANLPAGIQKEIYTELTRLTPTEITQVKGILNNTQIAVQKGQDLLDPQKLFASSYSTLTTPIRVGSVGFRGIYEASGSINPELNDLGENLKGIIPDDLAVANSALGRSFLQVKGISNTSSDSLAASILELENLRDLPLIAGQEEYVTQPVIDYWKNYYGEDFGIQLTTGNNGSYVVSDIVGFAAGYNSGQPLQDNGPLLTSLNNNGAFVEFTQSQGIYETIQQLCAGAFTAEDPMSPGDWYTTIPAGWAAAGVYGPFATELEAFEDAWLNGIIPYTAVASTDIYENYPDAQTVNANETIWQEQYGREYLNRQRADLIVTDIRASDTTAINFGQSLPQFGRNTEFGGPAMWLERVANANSLGGQALIAAMREGRNQARLDDAGIKTDTALATEQPQFPGTLAPNTLTKEEADALVIRS
jgi:hypothetical protein